MDGIDLRKHELVLVLGTLPINIYKKLYISYTHKQITLHVKSNYFLEYHYFVQNP